MKHLPTGFLLGGIFVAALIVLFDLTAVMGSSTATPALQHLPLPSVPARHLPAKPCVTPKRPVRVLELQPSGTVFA